MHVAQFVHRYPPALGGAESWTERLSRHLANSGYKVTVWTTTALELSSFSKRGWPELPAGTSNEDGVEVRRFTPSLRFPGRRYLLKAASLFPNRSWQSLALHWAPIPLGMWRNAGTDTSRPDVVHALAFPYGPIIRCALRLARRSKARFVLTPFLHLGDPDDPKDSIRKAYTAPYLSWLLRQADRVLVQTPTEERAVRDMGIPEERVTLQGLGVDPDECIGGNREEARCAWGVQPDEVVVGHLANLSMEKGSADVVAAVEIARQAGVAVRVILAGPEMPSFRQFWKWSGPDAWIVRTGPLSDRQRRDFYAGIDLFVLPSRSDSFGLVFLEAWANGVPVIGYRAGGVGDVIRHDVDGLLVKCGDMDALAAAIQRLVSDRELRERMGRAGQERLARDFRWEDKLEIARKTLTAWS
jgi:glycosyltransferase involved in cell wall biosynthesis